MSRRIFHRIGSTLESVTDLLLGAFLDIAEFKANRERVVHVDLTNSAYCYRWCRYDYLVNVRSGNIRHISESQIYHSLDYPGVVEPVRMEAMELVPHRLLNSQKLRELILQTAREKKQTTQDELVYYRGTLKEVRLKCRHSLYLIPTEYAQWKLAQKLRILRENAGEKRDWKKIMQEVELLEEEGNFSNPLNAAVEPHRGLLNLLNRSLLEGLLDGYCEFIVIDVPFRYYVNMKTQEISPVKPLLVENSFLPVRLKNYEMAKSHLLEEGVRERLFEKVRAGEAILIESLWDYLKLRSTSEFFEEMKKRREPVDGPYSALEIAEKIEQNLYT